MLKDKGAHSDVRWRAAHALGEIGDVRAVEPLISVLKEDRVPQYARGGASYALGQIGDGRAIDALLDALADNRSLGAHDSIIDPDFQIFCETSIAFIGEADPERYCREFVEKGRTREMSYALVFGLCLRLGIRLEPWDMEEELAAQRVKRAKAESSIHAGGAIVVENKEGNVVVIKDSKVEGGVRQQVVSGSRNKVSQDGQSDPLWSLVTKYAGKLWKWLRSLFGAAKP